MGEPENGIRANLDNITARPAPRLAEPAQPVLPSAGASAIETEPAPGVYLAAVNILCYLAVVSTSPLNFTLLIVSWGLVDLCFGGSVADNSPWLIILLAALIQTGLFALLWLPVHLMTRKRPLAIRIWSVVILSLLYLGGWIGWTAWLAAEMTRTNSWP